MSNINPVNNFSQNYNFQSRNTKKDTTNKSWEVLDNQVMGDN